MKTEQARTPQAPQTTQQPHYLGPDDGYALWGCQCQAYGKSGCPYPSGKCIVCGYKVNPNGRLS